MVDLHSGWAKGVLFALPSTMSSSTMSSCKANRMSAERLLYIHAYNSKFHPYESLMIYNCVPGKTSNAKVWNPMHVASRLTRGGETHVLSSQHNNISTILRDCVCIENQQLARSIQVGYICSGASETLQSHTCAPLGCYRWCLAPKQT